MGVELIAGYHREVIGPIIHRHQSLSIYLSTDRTPLLAVCVVYPKLVTHHLLSVSSNGS